MPDQDPVTPASRRFLIAGAAVVALVAAGIAPYFSTDSGPKEGRKAGNFFFQAEDGIRDLYVNGVQTCALPISTIRVVAAAGAAAAGAGNGSNSSPTRSLSRSSKVTRPAVPPNSSSTTAKCCPPRCISSIRSAARVVAGTVNGERT